MRPPEQRQRVGLAEARRPGAKLTPYNPHAWSNERKDAIDASGRTKRGGAASAPPFCTRSRLLLPCCVPRMGVAHHPALLGLVQLSDFEPLRVASHTDMTTAVHFSLERLAVSHSTRGRVSTVKTRKLTRVISSKQTTPERPLVLHTLPPPPPSPPTLSSAPDPSPSAAQISQKQVETAVDAIPKLVSILEIIKRELPSCSDPGNGAKPSSPLHQYTRLTTFESALDYQRPAPAEVQAETQDLEAVRQELVQLEWLSGRAGKAKRCGFPFLCSRERACPTHDPGSRSPTHGGAS